MNKQVSSSSRTAQLDNDQQRTIFCIPYLTHLCFKFRNELTSCLTATILIANCNLYLNHLDDYRPYLRLRNAFPPFYTPVLFISIRVVAVVPHITLKHREIIKFVVTTTCALVKMVLNSHLPVNHSYWTILSKLGILGHLRISA